MVRVSGWVSEGKWVSEWVSEGKWASEWGVGEWASLNVQRTEHDFCYNIFLPTMDVYVTDKTQTFW